MNSYNSALLAISWQLNKYKIERSLKVASNMLAYIAFHSVKDNQPSVGVDFVYGSRNYVKLQSDDEPTNIFATQSYSQDAIDIIEEMRDAEGSIEDYHKSLFVDFEEENFSGEEFEAYFDDYFLLLSIKTKQKWFEEMGVGRWIAINDDTMKMIANGNFSGVDQTWFEKATVWNHLNDNKFASKWDAVNLGAALAIAACSVLATPLAVAATIIYLAAYIALVCGSANVLTLTLKGHSWKNYLRMCHPVLISCILAAAGMSTMSIVTLAVFLFNAIPRWKWSR